MSRLCIDTNVYTALMARDHRVADILSSSEAVILPAVVIGELLGALLLTLDSHFEAVDGLRRYPLPNVT